MRFRGIRVRREGYLPSVKFSGRQNDDPVVSRRVVPDELADDISTQRSGAEDGKDFEGDDDWIGCVPPEIDGGVFFPNINEYLSRSRRKVRTHLSQRTFTLIHGPAECGEV